MKIKQVLAMKKERGHPELYAVDTGFSLRDVAKKLCEYDVGAALVREPDAEPGVFVGLVSERDIMRRLCCDHEFHNVNVTAALTPTNQLVVAKLADDVNYVVKVMTSKHIRHIPVVATQDDPKIVGFLSMRDLLYADIDEKTVTIHHLSDFLGGTYRNEVY